MATTGEARSSTEMSASRSGQEQTTQTGGNARMPSPEETRKWWALFRDMFNCCVKNMDRTMDIADRIEGEVEQ